jgi:hypothetical protein
VEQETLSAQAFRAAAFALMDLANIARLPEPDFVARIPSSASRSSPNSTSMRSPLTTSMSK